MSLGRWPFRSLLLVIVIGPASCIVREPKPVQPSASAALPSGASTGVPRGVSVLAPSGLDSFQVHGEAEKVEVTFTAVAGQSFEQAIHADIKQPSNTEWSVQLQAPTAVAVEQGDILLATFHVRSTKLSEDGTAQTQFVFERAREPYTKSVTHSLWIGSEWRKVQARFQAAESYQPGEAQMIFRLGYDPSAIEIGGVQVENFAKTVALAKLPTTEARDRTPPAVASAPVAVVDGGPLGFDVKAEQVVGPISPYVYGVNSQQPGRAMPALRRMGGNRQTAYNWEINASSAGRDWHHVNDNWPCTNLGYTDCDRPGAQMVDFVLENQKLGAASLLTIPLIDFVSADTQGTVAEKDKAPSKRFVRSYPKKPGSYAKTPDLADGAVYQDEFVNFLVQRFGRADKGGVPFYALDNEPALWSETHPRVHPEHATYREVVDRTEALASAITAIDPSAIVLGGVMYGFGEFMALQSAPDAAEYNEKFGTYIDFYLNAMKELEQKHRRRLVHALDVHWYPEVKGRARITEPDTSPKTIDARLAAPRSLWEAEYRERSWIADRLNGPVRLLSWLKEIIDRRYPGTKLAMTEYNYGAGDHISGGLAQADVLGIFGREGVYLAAYWGNGAGVGSLPKYIEAAFALYRNYDGQGHRFGDTAVSATPEDLSKASIYAATDSKKPGRLTLLVINKDQRANHQGTIRLGQARLFRSAAVYRLDASSPDIQQLPPIAVNRGVAELALPALSATLLVCE